MVKDILIDDKELSQLFANNYQEMMERNPTMFRAIYGASMDKFSDRIYSLNIEENKCTALRAPSGVKGYQLRRISEETIRGSFLIQDGHAFLEYLRFM